MYTVLELCCQCLFQPVPRFDRSPLPRILDEDEAENENRFLSLPPTLSSREVSPPDGIDQLGMEVCDLQTTLEVCPLPPSSDSGTELGPTTKNLESFGTIVSDLTQILFSQDEGAVIASAQ